jgi:hypothetical protein
MLQRQRCPTVQHTDQLAFYNYAMAYLSACHLDIVYSQHHLMVRLQRMAVIQVDLEDAQLIFYVIP